MTTGVMSFLVADAAGSGCDRGRHIGDARIRNAASTKSTLTNSTPMWATNFDATGSYFLSDASSYNDSGRFPSSRMRGRTHGLMHRGIVDTAGRGGWGEKLRGAIRAGTQASQSCFPSQTPRERDETQQQSEHE